MDNNNKLQQSEMNQEVQGESILKQTVLERFQVLKTKDDFLDLLNEILVAELKESSKKKFTISQLNYFLVRLAGKDDSNKKRLNNDIYSTFEIKKKSGAARVINAPNSELVLLLHCIDILVKLISKPHHCAYGFVEGKNIVDGARIHVGKNYVYNIDLKDFFHSFDLNRVKMGFYNEPFNLKGELEPIAYMIACLTTYKINDRRVLPQGSPASPSITNLLCWRLDHRLSGLAKRYGVDYTRYADDITFSSNHNCYKDEFITELKRIIISQGLTINPKKTRLQSKLIRQEVTGLTVNQKVNVTRKYIKDVRMYLYFCEQYGLLKATKIFEKDYRQMKSDVPFEKPPSIDLFLKGKLNYLSMVKGKDDATYLKLEDRYSKIFDSSATYVSSIIALWEKDGIDAARDKFYKDKKVKTSNAKKYILTKHFNELKDQSQSDQKKLITSSWEIGRWQKIWQEYFNENFPLDTFKDIFGWQFDTELELDLAYKKELGTGNQILLDSILVFPDIKVFIESKNNNDRIDFLLSYIKEDYKNFWDGLKNNIITEAVLREKFNAFKSKL